MPTNRARGAKLHPLSGSEPVFVAEHFGAPAPAALPDTVDLRTSLVPVFDQGQRPTCVGCSAATARALLHVLGKGDPSVTFDPAYIYKHANMLDGTLAADDGADPQMAVEAMEQFGCCPSSTETYAADDDTTAPTAAEDGAARPWRILSSRQCTDPTSAMQALAADMPLLVTVRAGNAFEADADSGAYVLSAASLNDVQTPWNHEQVLAGYTGGSSLAVGFWLLYGTWGTQYFKRGFYCIPKQNWSFFNQPIAVGLKAATA